MSSLSATTRVFAILGNPVAHTLSPLIRAAGTQVVVSAGTGYEDWRQSVPGNLDMAWDIELRR